MESERRFIAPPALVGTVSDAADFVARRKDDELQLHSMRRMDIAKVDWPQGIGRLVASPSLRERLGQVE